MGGYCPGPKSAERSGLWAEVAAVQVDAGPPSGWEWDHEQGLGLAFWWSLAGPGTGVQGTEPGGGAGGGRAAHQVGALPSLETPPSCPGRHGACGGATRRGLPPLRGAVLCPPCPVSLASSDPLLSQAAGLVARPGGAGLGTASSRFRGPYQGAVGRGGPQIIVGGLGGQLLQFFLFLLWMLLPRLQAKDLEEKGLSGCTDSCTGLLQAALLEGRGFPS